MIHIHHGYGVTVLEVVDADADCVESKVNVYARRIFAEFRVEDDLRLSVLTD